MLQLPVSHRWSLAPDQPFSEGWKEHGLRLFVRNTFIDVEDALSDAVRADAYRRGSRSCDARFCGSAVLRCREDQSPSAAKRASVAALRAKDNDGADKGDLLRDDETTSLASEDAEDTASSATEPWAEYDREEWPEDGGSALEESALLEIGVAGTAALAFDQTPTASPVAAGATTSMPGATFTDPTPTMGFCWPHCVSGDGWYSASPVVAPTFPTPYEHAEYTLPPVLPAAAALPALSAQQLLPAPPMYFAPVFIQEEDSASPPPSAAPSEPPPAVPSEEDLQQAASGDEAPAAAPALSPAPAQAAPSPPAPAQEEIVAGEASSEDEASLLSEGSRLHGTVGEDLQPACQPCAWFYKSSGCKNGRECFYCHLCPKEELKTRKKEKVARLRQQQPRCSD
jgi:hypothetical protein